MKPRPAYFKILGYLMTILFLFAAVVQYNDPDGLLWMGIYGAAAILTVLFILQKISWPTLGIAAAVSLLAAVVVGVAALNEGAIASAFRTWQMHSVGQEKAREAGGLLLTGAWLLAATLRVRKRQRRSGG